MINSIGKYSNWYTMKEHRSGLVTEPFTWAQSVLNSDSNSKLTSFYSGDIGLLVSNFSIYLPIHDYAKSNQFK